jgi:hypothetical protein
MSASITRERHDRPAAPRRLALRRRVAMTAAGEPTDDPAVLR